ncbi:cyclic nucleotide-gated ion channel 15-like protein [Trifolium pratense]|uniref:Cyclic nucleotide-gated ion channel 15-like protein n=1 Tax=Trifolium pratense TaxID=57577 RepID=A0A2K3MU16_TRIPR|nr:cyclic nucleotide-gated ion channel 15-like protein [Trifolium pratense]
MASEGDLELAKLNGKQVAPRILSRVFSEDYKRVRRRRRILDPRGQIIHQWNKIFLVACLVSLFVDPLFFYLPIVQDEACIDIGIEIEVVLIVIRSILDAFYIIHIFMRFHIAYVAPSSRVFGRGELVIDSSKIATRYLHKGFFLDFIAALPLPQVLIWIVIPNLGATGVVTETAWAGAAYNLMLYMLASHGNPRLTSRFCRVELGPTPNSKMVSERPPRSTGPSAIKFLIGSSTIYIRNEDGHVGIFYQLKDKKHAGRVSAKWRSHLVNMIFLTAIGLKIPRGRPVTSKVTASAFFNKYFFCLWWGLRNLSSLGQSLLTSTFVGEIMFAIVIAILGLVLFGLLIGNMQTYLQSTTVRLEEWRVKRTDTEQWMHHRQLPQELKQSVRKYDQYKWLATRGVDEESLLKGLPLDLRRDIKRHLCLELVRRVPFFDTMDERMLDAICERLKPALCTENTYLVREGDPVNEMLFIIRGHLDSYTTNGGRTGFFNSCRIGPGDFCGEELLTWALDPRPSMVIPTSTRTVQAISEVEGFALIAEDLKFVASQFRRLHSKQLRNKLRFHSHQWRTWAACFIQVAWRRKVQEKKGSY